MSSLPEYIYDDDQKILTINAFSDLNGATRRSLPWGRYKNEMKKIIIAEHITKIPSKVFVNCLALMSVKLPASIEMIENEAFVNCFHFR